MNQPYPLEQVTERAQQIWEQDGCPSGKAEENWLRAEQIVYGEEIELASVACGAGHTPTYFDHAA